MPCRGFRRCVQPASWAVYIGTRGESLGIYRSVLNATKGTLSEPELAAETANPAFLAIHPNRRSLYAVGEAGQFDRRLGRATGLEEHFDCGLDVGDSLAQQRPANVLREP